MRILVSRSGDGTSLGGAEMSARDHSIALKQLGHEPIILSSFNFLKEQSAKNGIEFKKSLWAYRDIGPLRYLYFAVVWPLMWLHYLYLTLTLKPDVIYPHSRDDQIIFTLLKPLHRRPVIWRDPSDLHYYLQNVEAGPIARFYRWFLIQAIKRVDRIYTLTEEEQGMIIEHSDGAADKNKVHHFPSNVLFSNYDLNATPVERGTNTVIGSMSRLVEDKGIQFLIKAFVKIADKRNDIELWIAGDGDFRDELEHLAAGHPRIKFLGHRNDLSNLFNTFDILVQPALYEGWGRNIKEGMYFGLPVVGSDVGGIALQLDEGKTGLKFAPGSVIELTKKLEKLLDNPAATKQLGKNAAIKAKKDGDFVTAFEKLVIPEMRKFIK